MSRIIGTERQRREALAKKADVYTIGRDNVAWLCGLYGGSCLPFDMVVIDELSSFKNPKSIRFKALKHVQASLSRVVGLTGTPAPNGLMDLWAQMYLLDRGERLGKYISHYRDNYFKPGRRNGHIVYSYDISKENQERIYSKIGDICMSMKAKDYLNLPERIDNIVEIPMPPEIQKAYDSFEEEQVLSMIDQLGDDVEIPAVNAAALSTKLLQFANGAIYDEQRVAHEVHTLKIEATKELIEDAGGQSVLIGWTFQHDRDRLMLILCNGLFHTNVYLLAADSILVPSIYSTSRLMKPLSRRIRTNCVKTLLISSFLRLRKRLIVIKSGRSLPASQI